ncbi:hypothetical protein JKP88DRAFT_248658 [Tribonema minus]|uniref:Uncharacterized protein n=1 Tax=Tribonema minus TaxID=303371 RepID=A0A835YW88_9STRA|nr:hypothetical protein JKP88DRAFT_248658 [Tribonema minus]
MAAPVSHAAAHCSVAVLLLTAPKSHPLVAQTKRVCGFCRFGAGQSKLLLLRLLMLPGDANATRSRLRKPIEELVAGAIILLLTCWVHDHMDVLVPPAQSRSARAKKAADKDSVEAKRQIGKYCHSNIHSTLEWTVAVLAAPQLVAPDLLVVALMVISGRRHKEIVCPGHQWAKVGTRWLQANLCVKGSAFNKSCKGKVKEADSNDGVRMAEFGLLEISEHVAEKFVALKALRTALYGINADMVLKALEVVRHAVKGVTDIERQNARDRYVRALLKVAQLADLFKGYKAHFGLRNLGVHLFRSVYQKPQITTNHLGVAFDIVDHEDGPRCSTSPQSDNIPYEVQQASAACFTDDNENIRLSNSEKCVNAVHPPQKDPATATAAVAADCPALLEAASDAGEETLYTPLQDPMSAATPEKACKPSALKLTEHTAQCLETLAEASGPTMIETTMTANDADIRPAARDACNPSKRQKIMSVVDGLVSAGFDVDTRLDILAKLLST